MKRIQIQAEVKVTLMKWIEMPDDEAAEFMESSDADILSNLDIMSDYHDESNLELIDIAESKV